MSYINYKCTSNMTHKFLLNLQCEQVLHNASFRETSKLRTFNYKQINLV